MPVWSSVALFVVGLVLTVKGADWFTDGSAALARRLRVSSLVIGLTIVAFGTSAPELVVSCVSGLRGQGEMAIGNVVGSNLFNTLAIMGLTAIVCPVACGNKRFPTEVLYCVVVSIILFAMAREEGRLEWHEGVILLCLLGVYGWYTFHRAHGDRSKENRRKREPIKNPGTDMPPVRIAALIVVGLTCLILGGEWFVSGATGIAQALGVSESVIALTIVAAGTSLPELVTSLVAARKGDTDMALGNIVGSNILNITLVLGATACICDLSLGDIDVWDFAAMTGSAVLLWLFCAFGDGKVHRINRIEGTILFLLAVAYYTWEVIIA